MAEAKKKRQLRKPEAIGEKTKKSEATKKQPKKRLGNAARAAAKPLKVFRVFGFIVPSYFKNSWRELKEVTWPSRKETWKLTLAVFMFAIIFGLIITVADYGLDKVFKKVLLK
jgi:preprotein translocase SecE subunit